MPVQLREHTSKHAFTQENAGLYTYSPEWKALFQSTCAETCGDVKKAPACSRCEDHTNSTQRWNRESTHLSCRSYSSWTQDCFAKSPNFRSRLLFPCFIVTCSMSGNLRWKVKKCFSGGSLRWNFTPCGDGRAWVDLLHLWRWNSFLVRISKEKD